MIGTPRRREYKFLSKELVKTTSADSAVEKDESDSTVAESGKESKDEKNQEWKTVVKRKQHKSSKEKDDHEDAKLEDMKKLQEEICVECGKTFIEGKHIDSSKKD